jgi:predicted dehydrogenase
VSVTIGLVGCGRWGQNVLRDLVALGVRVFVAEVDESRRELAIRHGAARSHVATDDLPECDGYVVVTPAHAHRPVSKTLLERAAPIFVEKPPCTSLAEVELLASLGAGRVFVMHKWRYHPAVIEMRLLGSPRFLSTVRTAPQRLPLHVDVAWHLAVHDLSIALELLGSVPPVVRAVGARLPDGRLRHIDAMLGNADGPQHHLVVAAHAPLYERRIELVGARGEAVWTAADAELPNQDQPLRRELGAFVDHLAGGPPPKSSIGDALGVCRAADAIRNAVEVA